LWGTVHFLPCSSCELTFPLKDFASCQFHPKLPQLQVSVLAATGEIQERDLFDSADVLVGRKDDIKTKESPPEEFINPFRRQREKKGKVEQEEDLETINCAFGVYPCCRKPGYKFYPLPSTNGCQFRDHNVSTTTAEQIMQRLTMFRDLIVVPPPKDKREEALSKKGTHFEWGSIVDLTPFKPISSSSLNLTHRYPTNRHLNPDHPSSTEESNHSNSFSDTEENNSAEVGGSHLGQSNNTSNTRPNTRSGQVVSEFWSWNSDFTTRYNQDMQREKEEKLMSDLELLLSQRVSLEPTSSAAGSSMRFGYLSRRTPKNLGGSFMKLEEKWRELQKGGGGAKVSVLKNRFRFRVFGVRKTTMNNFERGRESLLQALAIMRNEEEHKRKYGGVSEILNNRRETSVAVLSDMIVRMKREIDGKNKCVKFFEDIAGWWKDVQDERQRMYQRIKDLEQENADLQKKLGGGTSSISSYNWNPKDNKSPGIDDNFSTMHDTNDHGEVTTDNRKSNSGNGDSENSNDLSGSYLQNDSVMQNEDQNGDDDEESFHSRYGTTTSANDNVDWMKSPTSSNTMASFPPLISNPYDSLDTSYYNPTQFFQRLSSTSVRKGKPKRGGASGSRISKGKKSQPAAGKAKEKAAAKRKSGANNSSAPDINQVIELDPSPGESDATNQSVSIYGNMEDGISPTESTQNGSNDEPVVETIEESPDKSYFDYTSTFLDETENLRDV
ncbi:hypothetical protein Fcan01_10059, partial [Folsomia candida]